MTMKIRSLAELQDVLDSDLAWRKKEILYLRMQAKNAAPTVQKTLLRAGIALLYAHWEGFIKGASLSYLQYINDQRLPLNQLNSCFAVFGIKGHLNELSQSRKAKGNREIVEFLITKLGEKLPLNLSNAVDTESNLQSKVFDNIATSLDIETTSYQTSYNLIDQSLVRKRNSIAHGEFLDLKVTDLQVLTDEILTLMDCYKTDISNAAATKKFQRKVA
jgi:MAE_28990/MAE_18760-like HEPN